MFYFLATRKQFDYFVVLLQNIYKAAAKEVMDKYNITAELPEIQQAMLANKQASQVSNLATSS